MLGEFGVRNLLAQEFNQLEAQRLAAGWNGDRYQVYESSSNGPTALLWTTAWETEADAGEFEAAYRRLAAKRGVAADVKRENSHVRVMQAKDGATLDEWK